jgi:hypothetical protein
MALKRGIRQLAKGAFCFAEATGLHI